MARRPLLNVEIDDSDLLLDFDHISAAIDPELERLNAEIGQLVEDAAEGPTPVRTGFLLGSIFWEPDGKLSVTVGPHADYAPFVHERVPFMLIAFQNAEPEIDRLIDAAAERIVES